MSAMHEELSAVLAEMADQQRVTVAGRDFWVGHWQGHSVVAVLSRIGKVAASTTASILLDRFQAGSVVFTGVAGGLAPEVRVGDVVVAQGFIQHDMDASPLCPKYEVPFYGRACFDAAPSLSAQLARASAQVLASASEHLGHEAMGQFKVSSPRVHQGLLISGDRFVSTSAESRILSKAFPSAMAVEMEGAAVAQVCWDYKAAFAAVRTVSDRADDAAHMDFQSFVSGVASRYSLAILSHWLKELPKEGPSIT
ncbi:5'-methylthioadenosine/adenosylhomocysteine nucleosidase [Limnohabitans sp. Rim8]|uniref:5'-methylthioadenosine/adenosylhomocysteine nucleosidase n=1 Tax=Limnohabitans sp. Rim8 TaxID=1100718 RepID=UPI002604295C|nr:5'-methylthioadenosine/adenosylhomocysteine nucleosidase [Limnohabitans sp. Rim8]